MLFRLNDELEYFEDKKDIDNFLTETYGYDFQQFVYNTYKEHLIELIENKIDQGFVEEFAFESDLDETIVKWFKDNDLLKSDKLPVVNFSEFIIDLFTAHAEFIKIVARKHLSL